MFIQNDPDLTQAQKLLILTTPSKKLFTTRFFIGQILFVAFICASFFSVFSPECPMWLNNIVACGYILAMLYGLFMAVISILGGVILTWAVSNDNVKEEQLKTVRDLAYLYRGDLGVIVVRAAFEVVIIVSIVSMILSGWIAVAVVCIIAELIRHIGGNMGKKVVLDTIKSYDPQVEEHI